MLRSLSQAIAERDLEVETIKQKYEAEIAELKEKLNNAVPAVEQVDRFTQVGVVCFVVYDQSFHQC
jgi:predicted transcriptional regulator